jgi:hypothetical protein
VLSDRRLPDPGAVNPESRNATAIHGHNLHFATRDGNSITHAR